MADRRQDWGDEFPGDVESAAPLSPIQDRATEDYAIPPVYKRQEGQFLKSVKVTGTVGIADSDFVDYLIVQEVVAKLGDPETLENLNDEFMAYPWFGQSIEHYENAENIVMCAIKLHGYWRVMITGDMPFTDYENICTPCEE